MKRSALLLALALSSGCYKMNYINAAPSGAQGFQDEWRDIIIFGLVELDDPVALDQVCPNGWAKVHNERTFENGLVSFALSLILLGWVYTPHATTVWCVGGTAYDVELNTDGLVTTIALHDDGS
jgi:hypothetical protein